MPHLRHHRVRVRSDLFRVYRTLRPDQLGMTDQRLSDADVALDRTLGRVDLAFGIYSEAGLRRALEAYGTLRRLEERGVGPLAVRLELDDPFRPVIKLVSQTYGVPVLDVRLSRIKGEAVGLPPPRDRAPLLFLDSIVLQHPGRTFEWSRPPLPEQRHPGLSAAAEVLDLLLLLAKRIDADGMALVPSTFHAARIYERHFQFVDGEAEGIFRALRHAGELRPLWLLAWACELGCVTEGGRPFRWEPRPMLAPLTEELAAHFDQPAYLAAEEQNAHRELEVDIERLRERFPWELMPEGPPPLLLAALLRPPKSSQPAES